MDLILRVGVRRDLVRTALPAEVCRDSLRLMIRDLYHERVALLEGGMLDEWEKADFLAVLDGNASEEHYEGACPLLGHDQR